MSSKLTELLTLMACADSVLQVLNYFFSCVKFSVCKDKKMCVRTFKDVRVHARTQVTGNIVLVLVTLHEILHTPLIVMGGARILT